MPTPSPDLHKRIVQIVAHDSGVATERIFDSTRLVEDLHLDGDDVYAIVERVAAEFGVDAWGYRRYHHAGPEECVTSRPAGPRRFRGAAHAGRG